MEQFQTSCPELNNFLEDKQREILALAQQKTEEVVKREMALTEFELLLSANMSEKEQKKLTANSRKLREDSYKELSKISGEDFNGICNLLNEV
jgi:RNA polymerase-binding transcription factor DksA